MIQYFVENAIVGVTLISIVVSFFITLLYKLMINQKEAKANKEKMKGIQAEVKELMKSGKQKEAMEKQKEMQVMSMKQMRSTMKPMVVTLLLVLPVFAFAMPSLYGIEPTTLQDGQGTFEYRGETYPVTYTIQDEGTAFEANGYKFEYAKYDAKKSQLLIKRIVAETPVPIPFAGTQLGWLGWYVLVSIPFSVATRKLLGVV